MISFDSVADLGNATALGYNYIVTVKHKLVSEYLGTVLDIHKVRRYLRVKSHRVVKLLKKAYKVDILSR